MSPQYTSERWVLDDLFPAFDSAETEKALAEMESSIKDFEAKRPTLNEKMDSTAFVEMLEDYDQLIRRLSRLLAYAHLRFAEDTQDQEAQTQLGRYQQIIAEADNRTMFFKLWWKALDDDNVQRLLKPSGDFRYFLEALRLEKPFTLSEAEEKVVNLKDVNGLQALIRLYDSITNRYVFKLEVDGQVREMTRGELSMYVRETDADIRAAAYKEMHRVYTADVPVLGQIYQAVVGDWNSENVGLRGYANPISVRNMRNDIPDRAIETLIDVSRKNIAIFQDYFKLKARWLGVDKIRRYDIYAPVESTSKAYAYGEAIDIILESFNKFEPRFATLARKILDEKRIDTEVRKGKRSGAFCAPIEPALTPWVLTNFQGKADDMATLAHELGHAVHTLLAADHTALTQDSCLPLAETASTFSEMLLVDYLLSNDPDPALQRDMLFRQMDDNYATIMRQVYFAIFEREAHTMIRKGASLDDLNKAYMQNLQEQFGDSMEISSDFEVEWAEIPHIYHTPFYVYAYSFGQLLVLSLYKQYQEEGESFKPRYVEILAAGGSASPETILARAGIDMYSPAFWQGGYDVIRASLEELKGIAIPG